MKLTFNKMNKLIQKQSKRIHITKPTIHKELLLEGDRREILSLGHMYSTLNNLPIIAADDLHNYLAGRPLYLGEQSRDQWGMSFEDARRCLYDVVRTQKLIQGIVHQIQQIKRFSTEEIHVVEAGGGTGILAIAAALAGAKVTLLEINTETEKRTREFIEFLGLSEKITVVFANARNYIPNEKIDIIVCECLHTGLALEPQLQILNNLGKFLKPRGKILPEGVTLRWSLADVDWSNIQEPHTEFRNLGKQLHSKGEWSEDTHVNFYDSIGKEEIEDIRFTMPVDTLSANTILVEMDTIIYREDNCTLMLRSGEAEFLGHPHAIKLKNVVDPSVGTHVSITIKPGINFPDYVQPISRKVIRTQSELQKKRDINLN